MKRKAAESKLDDADNSCCFTVALSNMVNAIGEGTSEAMKKSVTIGSVCIIILGGMLSAYHTKKSMEKIKRRIPNW